MMDVLLKLTYLYIKQLDMSKQPYTENTEVFTMRISVKLKDKLNKLAENSIYGGSASSTLRYLIESASRR